MSERSTGPVTLTAFLKVPHLILKRLMVFETYKLLKMWGRDSTVHDQNAEQAISLSVKCLYENARVCSSTAHGEG